MVMTPLSIISGLALLAVLLLLSWTDIKSYRLPDKLTFSLMGLGLIEGFISNILTERLIGMAIGYLVFVGIEYSFKALRGKDGLGRGDAKLLAAGGAWCGWMGLPFIVLIAKRPYSLRTVFSSRHFYGLGFRGLCSGFIIKGVADRHKAQLWAQPFPNHHQRGLLDVLPYSVCRSQFLAAPIKSNLDFYLQGP